LNKTSIITLRIPVGVRRGLERLAAQLGYKPAHLGTRLVEEGLRRRHYPHIDLRDTAAGRVAYLKGTRLAVYWIAQRVEQGLSAQKVAREFDVAPEYVTSALAYAQAFPAEIQTDSEGAAANGRWIELQESAWRAGHPKGKRRTKAKSRK
jgi:uncharacterized protein (DUF433 family)